MFYLNLLKYLLKKSICDDIVKLQQVNFQEKNEIRQISDFFTKMNKLFNILVCKCLIIKCEAFDCSKEYTEEVDYKYKCGKQLKLPNTEVKLI